MNILQQFFEVVLSDIDRLEFSKYNWWYYIKCIKIYNVYIVSVSNGIQILNTVITDIRPGINSINGIFRYSGILVFSK